MNESRRARALARPNLDFLLRRRVEFMRPYLAPADRVLEVGAGLGIVGLYISGLRLVDLDLTLAPWRDVVADSTRLPFADGVFDAVVCMHVLHHLDRPRVGVEEMLRVVRPGGRLLVAEPHLSAALRLVLALTRHEHVERRVDPFGSESCRRPGAAVDDGNNAIPDLLFGNLPRFQRAFPGLVLEHHRLTECLTFLNSGGVGYRAPYLPLPPAGLALVGWLDEWLDRFPRLLPTARELVFRKLSS